MTPTFVGRNMRCGALLACAVMLASSNCVRPAQSQGAAPASDADAATWLQRAGEELLRSNVSAYHDALKHAATAQGKAEDHAAALAELANYQWRIEADVAAARSTLRSAGELAGNEQPAPLLERARLEFSLQNFEASRTAALAALNTSQKDREKQRARIAFGLAVAGEATQAAFSGSASAAKAELDALMQQALTLLRVYVTEETGLREPSQLALLAALWTGDGSTAVRAWESYFRLAPGDGASGPLTAATQTVRALPASLADATPELRAQIVQALGRARLFPAAAALVAHWRLAAIPEARDELEYARWTSQVTHDFDESYRQIALGKRVVPGRERLEQHAHSLWRALHGDERNFNFERFTAEVRDRFGAVIRPIPPGANYGHIVSETLQNVDQYGHKAQLRSIVLDSMISNGYTTWLWDGRANIGGWSADAEDGQPATIVSVRGDYAVGAWDSITNADTIERNKEKLERWIKEDDERARRDPYAYLPGLALRMRLAGAQRVYDRERASGLEGPALRSAFLAEYERLEAASSITAHEGRHALDKQSHELALGAKLLLGNAGEELEYRAKLSEMAFAPEPLIATNAIFSSNIGRKGDAHGMANLRVMQGVVAWMKQHAAEIKGLDSMRPLLPQFDLLTDDQMRAAFRALDPWTPGHA